MVLCKGTIFHDFKIAEMQFMFRPAGGASAEGGGRDRTWSAGTNYEAGTDAYGAGRRDRTTEVKSVGREGESRRTTEDHETEAKE